MARMSIDDMVVRDPRITKLARLVGWSRRETIGCLVMDVWPICYDQREFIIAADLVDLASGLEGFATHMVDSGLASWARGSQKIRIRGAQERIRYLDHKSEAGRVGGLKSGESRNKNSSTASSLAEARGNPSSSASVPPSASVPVPDVVPVQEKNSATPSASGALPGFRDQVAERRTRKPKPSAATEAERAAALRVLAKLSERNGIAYSGTNEHIGLISRHLRSGVAEMDLRYVVAYCAAELGWAAKPDMAPYLRPETLFGPKTLSKYLDAARTWVSKLPDDNQPQSGAA